MKSPPNSLLPDLPAVRKKREAEITPRVLSWFRENHHASCAIEIKVGKGNTIAENKVLPHQLRALLDASASRGIVHKLTDEARRQQPFDAFQLVAVSSYVVACFMRTRTCHVIPVAEWRGIASASKAYRTFSF